MNACVLCDERAFAVCCTRVLLETPTLIFAILEMTAYSVYSPGGREGQREEQRSILYMRARD